MSNKSLFDLQHIIKELQLEHNASQRIEEQKKTRFMKGVVYIVINSLYQYRVC